MGLGNIYNDINKGLYTLAIEELNDIKKQTNDNKIINAIDELIILCQHEIANSKKGKELLNYILKNLDK